LIRFEHVSKVYGEKRALDDVSIEISDGEFVFIVGPTAAGKSTFIKLMSKEIDPDSGSIYIDDEDITEYSNRQVPELRKRIGMVFQDFRLLPNKTVYENVAFAMEVVHYTRRTIDRQVPQVLALMGIADKADSFPDKLSGGEQQRVAIARAIINNPGLLIADEPTGNLDPSTAFEIMKLIDQINKRGTTVVMVTHAKEIVDRMGKRVITIDHGRVVKDSKGGYGYDV